MVSETVAPEPLLDVLYITRKWPPAMGGMETYSLRLTEELNKLVAIDVVALPGRPDGRPPRTVALLRFPLTVLAHWFSRPTVPDVLHLGDMAVWPMAILSWFAFGRTRVTISAHGTDVSYQRRKGLKGRLYGHYLRLGARLLRNATVIANSRATREVAAETGWHCSCVIPLATDMRGPEPDGSHDGSILFAGRLVELKGGSWFIREVFPLLPADIVMKVAGTVWAKSEGNWLENPRIKFLGPLNRDELARAYARALCVVIPNIPVSSGEYEGFGLVAPEAASAGGVVIASACDGLLDAVIDEETGLFARPGDAGHWRQRIMEVAGWDATQRRTFIAQSMAIAAERFSWTRVARQTMEAY